MENIKLLSAATIVTVAMLVASCAKEQVPSVNTDTPDVAKEYWMGPEFTSNYKSSGDAIYSLRNVQKGLDELVAKGLTRATTLQPTHHYVRFLPQNEADIRTLHDDLDFEIFHSPFDHELTQEELDMHLDTRINGYGWQYCLVTPDFEMPNMRWELLDYVYLQPDEEEDITRSGKSYQLPAEVYSAAIDKSEEITGNATPETRASAWNPSGTITFADRYVTPPLLYKSYKVPGVYVRANTDFNSGNAYTDNNGYFWIKKGWGGKFRRKVHYMAIWYKEEGQYQWKIHDSRGKADTKRDGDAWIKGPWNPIFGDGLGERDDAEFAFCAAIHFGLDTFFHHTTGLKGAMTSMNVRERYGESAPTSMAEASSFDPSRRDPIEVYSIGYGLPNQSGKITYGVLRPQEVSIATMHRLMDADMYYAK